MGKSSSCFKIITCGSDSADKDDLDVPENNVSTDKRGWSFRKRSARHRVLSNTVISETPSSANKESPESANINYQSLDTSSVPEKVSAIQCTDEKTQLPIVAESKTATVAVTKIETEVDVPLEESVVIIIQSAARGFLARKELLKLKNVVKLQAAVRGHLVRQHAIGTLRCVQAIVKMQVLVRARRARLLSEGKNLDGNNKTSSKDKPITKPNITTYTSIEKLLSNKFARQLMESTPKSRPIRIKCDSQKPDSAWNWLERWMSVSSVDPTPKSELIMEQVEKEKIENLASPGENRVTLDELPELLESKADETEVFLQPESEENLKTASDVKEASVNMHSLPNQTMQSDLNSQMEINSLSSKPEMEDKQPDQPKRSMKRVASEELETEGKKFVYESRKASNPAFIAAQSKFEDLSSSVNSNKSFQKDSEVGLSLETVSSGLDNVTGTKELNLTENSVPHNVAVQYGGSECGTELSITSTLDSPDVSEVRPAECEHETKISEETYTLESTKDIDVEAKDASSNPKLDLHHSVMDQTEKQETCEPESTKDLDVEAKDASSNPELDLHHSVMDQTEKQETCKPESTKDLDVEAKDASSNPELDLHHSVTDQTEKQEICKPESTKDLDVEVKGAPTDLELDLYHSVMGQTEKLEHVKYESGNSNVAADPQQVELKLERNTSDAQDFETGGPANRSSPEASPRSRITVPESQETPSSQISVKSKMNRTEKSSSNQKRKSLSVGKRSPSNPTCDFGTRTSMDQLPKDQKVGKRRNSFGSTRPEQADQEPRDSGSSTSVPRFMQATESARAKISATNSPRSSPDMQDRDYIKKRHSLPGANGRQGSPRIQQSTSQAQQGAKGSASHVVHEKKWQR